MGTNSFPLAGRSFEVDYGDLVATNAYQSDGQTLTYEITAGALKGNKATVSFEWRLLHEETYVISWQEADGATVVHIDDFRSGRSLSFSPREAASSFGWRVNCGRWMTPTTTKETTYGSATQR